jgi:predicted Asp-tRNA(Asn)/Glu-tRNA(Gln) amidotransferase subunit C
MRASREEVERSAEEIVEEFTRVTEGLPTVRESYYGREEFNIMRPDGEPAPEGKLVEFKRRFLSIAPGSDEEGNVCVEVAGWVER